MISLVVCAHEHTITATMLWSILLLLQPLAVQSSFVPASNDLNDNSLFPSSDWDTTIGEIISTLERSTANNSSVLSNLLPLFFTTDTTSFSSKPKRPWLFQQVSDRVKRLVDSSSPAFTSLVVDALDLQDKLRTYKSYDNQIRLMFSPTAISTVQYQSTALANLISECEVLYAKLVGSSDNNQTFFMAVPLAFIHLPVLREKLATSDVSQQYEAQRNLTVWMATYWQFVSDGYLSWKEWRLSQLQIDRWVQTTLVQNICHALLWDKLFKRHLINLQLEDCNDPAQLDAHFTSVFAQSSNQIEFEMMAIVSKIFVLHKFIPGYETLGPFPANFPTTLRLGPIQPLTYRSLWNETLPNDTAIFDTTCQPLSSPALLKGITSVTLQQWNWVEDIRVQYENGTDRFPGTPGRGGRVESGSFNPNSDQCLASITWRLSTINNMVTSVTFASRNGESVGSEWNTRAASDVTIYTTAPLLYCITNVAICTAPANSTSAVTSFKVSLDLQNVTKKLPVPLLNGLKLIKGNPTFVLIQKGSSIESTQSLAVNRFMDALGFSLPMTVPKKSGNQTRGRVIGKQTVKTTATTTKTPVTRKNTPAPAGGNELPKVHTTQQVATPEILPETTEQSLLGIS